MGASAGCERAILAPLLEAQSAEVNRGARGRNAAGSRSRRFPAANQGSSRLMRPAQHMFAPWMHRFAA